MTRPAEPTSEGADLALAIYVEELVRGARVLWMGEPGPGAVRLSESAKSLEVLPPPRRSRGARRGPRLAQRGWLGPADAQSYQLVVVPDALGAGLADAGRLADVARSIAPDGVVVLATEARDGSYERFHEHAQGAFGVVRMVGVTPFAGVAVVDFASADGSAVSFDGTALTGAAPEPMLRWVAVCGTSAQALEPYLVVQLPAGARTSSDGVESAAVQAPAPAVPPAPAPVASTDRAAPERELEAARARLEHAEERLEQAQREIARSGQKLDALRHEAERAAAAIAERDHALSEAIAGRLAAERALDGAASAVEDGELAAELRALEARLAAQGRELTELRIEAERRATIVRDLAEELAAAHAARPAGVVTAAVPVAALGEGAQRRIAEAEAMRAVAGFRADELGQELAVVRHQLESERARSALLEDQRRSERESSSAAIVATRAEIAAELAQARAELAAELAQAHAGVSAELAQAHAELAAERAQAKERETQNAERTAERDGTVRGLLSRAAEFNEIRLQTEARLALAQSDLVVTQGELRRLEAQLGRAQEELELALLQRGKGRGREDAAEALERAALGAEHAELEAEIVRLRAALVLAEHEREAEHEAGLRRAATIEVERDSASANAHAAAREVERLRDALAAALAERADLDSLVGERDGLRMRLGDAEAALAEHLAHEGELERARAELERVRAAEASLASEHSSASVALDGLRQERIALEDRAARAERERDAERARVAVLIARVAARDGLIQGRQSAIAQATQREREESDRAQTTIAALEARLEESTESLAALRDVAAVRADAERREGGDREARLAEAEAAGARAASRVRAARAALEEIRAGLAASVEAQRLVVSDASRTVAPRELERVQRELDDRDLMLRSLTAQLEERDDRLRALERGRGGAATGDLEELGQRLLVAEEREARLRAELEAANRRGGDTPAADRADIRRLEQLALDRDAYAMQVEGALAAARREEQVLREVIAQTRADVEIALSGVGIEPPGDTAERLAEALRLLHRL